MSDLPGVAESGQFVYENADHIKIIDAGLNKCAEDMSSQIMSGDLDLKSMFVKTDVHPQKADESGIDWVVFADTLNFSFWMQESEPQYLVTYRGTTYNGYLALCAAINKSLDSGVELTKPEFFKSISEERLNELLMGDGGVPIPLLADRVKCLHEVGTVLCDKYGGKFTNLMAQCDNSAVKLLQMVLDNFTCFRDVSEFKGKTVSIHKRAQILVADLWCLFEGTGQGSFSDIHSLTMFADYRVPQSLQHYGVFQYDNELLEFLMKDVVMPNGHKYEVEIRGCSIHAVELLTAKIRKILDDKKCDAVVNSILVDQYLWGYRRKHAEEMKKFPFHKVRSIYY
eukprot:TRINITY_DN5406_c0_g2_i3.p1 TRINITY_DN5406_c0_g2~~TRINITY_DN5406_c0_g2_i3.p1  ORF type:complete len:340 (+),score=51.08 TRINITY_DN5406_c0_g2_i3:37-1056(+)